MSDTCVEVNECAIRAVGRGADQWFDFRSLMNPVGRIEIVQATIVGDVVRVTCDDREHADWLRGTMIHQWGVPDRAVAVLGKTARVARSPGESESRAKVDSRLARRETQEMRPTETVPVMGDLL